MIDTDIIYGAIAGIALALTILYGLANASPDNQDYDYCTVNKKVITECVYGWSER